MLNFSTALLNFSTGLILTVLSLTESLNKVKPLINNVDLSSPPSMPTGLADGLEMRVFLLRLTGDAPQVWFPRSLRFDR